MRLVSGADESWPAGALIVGGGRLHGRLAGSVEGSSVLVPTWLCDALASGEVLSLPTPFWGGSQPPRSVVQRLRGRLIGLRMLLKSFTYVINEFYENVT